MSGRLLVFPTIAMFVILFFISTVASSESAAMSDVISFFSGIFNEISTTLKLFLKSLLIGATLSIFTFGKVALVIVGTHGILILFGRHLIRWSPKTKAHSITSNALLIRFACHGVGFFLLLITMTYSAWANDAKSIASSKADLDFIILSLFCIELFFFLFVWNYARQAIKVAKASLPRNKHFKIKTTCDQCWIYSTDGKSTYRTTLETKENGQWDKAYSYKTSESLDK